MIVHRFRSTLAVAGKVLGLKLVTVVFGGGFRFGCGLDDSVGDGGSGIGPLRILSTRPAVYNEPTAGNKLDQRWQLFQNVCRFVAKLIPQILSVRPLLPRARRCETQSQAFDKVAPAAA